MTAPASGLYQGAVTHKRLRPREHALRYRIFMLLLDLDELPDLFGRLRLLSRGRFGLMSFDPADHGDRSGARLRPQIEQRLAAAGIETGGPIRLLCMPRVLGYGFNPLSLFFCHRRDGRLAAILYEVTNTFGERHAYLIACDGREDELVRQTASKRMYVSPFMDMALGYRFTVRPPGEAVSVAVAVDDAEGLILSTAFTGDRRPLTDAVLLRAWLGHPLLTLKVIAAIHWEALKLLLKGVGLRVRPTAPRHAVTLVSPGPQA
jgi:DUF1365 family protein